MATAYAEGVRGGENASFFTLIFLRFLTCVFHFRRKGVILFYTLECVIYFVLHGGMHSGKMVVSPQRKWYRRAAPSTEREGTEWETGNTEHL